MIVTAIDLSHGLEGILNSLMTQGAALGWTLIKAFLVFIVGRLLINLVNKLIKRVLLKRDIDPSVKTFVGSLVNVVLTILLIISVVGALGVQTTSFAALLASAGVAVGMALWPVHAMEHQLSAVYDVTHGHGLAVLTPVWMRYILNDDNVDRFVNYGVNVFGISPDKKPYEIAELAIQKTEEVFEKMGLKLSMQDLGITDESHFESMAERAADGLDECQVPLDKDKIVEIYRKCMK